MKKILILSLLILGSFAVQAQELNWHTNIKEAIIGWLAVMNEKAKRRQAEIFEVSV